MKNKILELYYQGKSNVTIAKELNCCPNTVWRHLKSFGILRISMAAENIDWKHIQFLYDTGMSENDLRSKKIVTRTQLDNAKKNGLFVSRSLSESGKIRATKYPLTHTEEFKIQQSKRMKCRHSLGLAYTLGHNERLKKRSYPEQWFESVINRELTNQDYVSQYPFGRYCLDFAWIYLKKCVEVDGETHYRFDSEIKKDSKRDNWLKSQGWEIIRFRWTNVIKNKDQTIQQLRQFIDLN